MVDRYTLEKSVRVHAWTTKRCITTTSDGIDELLASSARFARVKGARKCAALVAVSLSTEELCGAEAAEAKRWARSCPVVAGSVGRGGDSYDGRSNSCAPLGDAHRAQGAGPLC
jgi:hypothetical protein